MSKITNKAAGKGILDLNFEGKATITFVDRNGGETVWDFFEILNRFDGKNISYSFTEDLDIAPIEGN